MNFLAKPLGIAIYYIYKIVPNYAVSIIIFTIILRIALIPLQIKSQKSMAKSSAFQPYLNEINKKYANNFQKKTEEIQKFQQEHGINPASGCLTSLIPVLVLFGIYDVIYNPLFHILHLSPQIIDSAINIFKVSSKGIGNAAQLNLISDVINNPARYSSLGSEVVESIKSINLDFLGFNIGNIATITSFSVIFPILSLVFSFIQIYISFKTNSIPDVNRKGIMKVFMFGAMPIFSLWISLSTPIGVSLYWIVGSLIQIVQTLILNKICNLEQLKQQEISKIEELKRKKKVKILDSGEKLLEGNERIAFARKFLSDKYDE